MAKKTTDFNFEQALGELEQLVERMERGELSLEESLKQFEHGIALTRACQKALTEAEQRVQTLLESAGKQQLAAFNPEDDAED